MLDYTKISKCNRTTQNITINIAIRSTQHIVSKNGIAYDDSVDANPNIVSNNGNIFSIFPILSSTQNTFVNLTIFIYNRFSVNRNVIGVIKYNLLPMLVAGGISIPRFLRF